MSKAEETLAFQLKAYKISFEREYRFHPTRKFRSDFGFPSDKLLVEVEGGIYSKGRHVRPKGYINDMEKYNEASRLGFRVLRFTPQQVEHGTAILTIKEELGIA